MSERAASALRLQSAQLGLGRHHRREGASEAAGWKRVRLRTILAVVEQEPDLAALVVEVGDRQAWSAKRRPGDRQASIGSDLPNSRCERRAPAISFGGTRSRGFAGDQLALEATADVATVLEREPAPRPGRGPI